MLWRDHENVPKWAPTFLDTGLEDRQPIIARIFREREKYSNESPCSNNNQTCDGVLGRCPEDSLWLIWDKTWWLCSKYKIHDVVIFFHFSDVTRVSGHFKSPTIYCLFKRLACSSYIKENIKLQITCHLILMDQISSLDHYKMIIWYANPNDIRLNTMMFCDHGNHSTYTFTNICMEEYFHNASKPFFLI